MELKTKSKRPAMDCSIDVFYEQTDGFSKYLDDKDTYKMVLVSSGSFIVEEDGEYRLISAPVGIGLNERAKLRHDILQAHVHQGRIHFRCHQIRKVRETLKRGKRRRQHDR